MCLVWVGALLSYLLTLRHWKLFCGNKITSLTFLLCLTDLSGVTSLRPGTSDLPEEGTE